MCPECAGDIVKYLFKQYGQGKSPSFGLLERYPTLLVWISFPSLVHSSHSMIQSSFLQYNFHRMGAYSSSSWKRDDNVEQSRRDTCREAGTLLIWEQHCRNPSLLDVLFARSQLYFLLIYVGDSVRKDCPWGSVWIGAPLRSPERGRGVVEDEFAAKHSRF